MSTLIFLVEVSIMLKPTKVHLAALVAMSAVSLTAQPVFAQFDDAEPGDMEEIDIVINVPEPGPVAGGDFFMPPVPPSAGMEMAFTMPFLPPGMTVGAMRGRGGPGGGPCPVGGLRRGGDCPLFMLDGENAVTDDQYEKLYQLKNRVMDQIGPKMLQLSVARRNLRDVLTAETIDDKAAKKLQTEIAGLKGDLESIKLDGKMSMMQILTAAQRKELRTAMIKGPGGRSGPSRHHMMKRFMERREGSSN